MKSKIKLKTISNRFTPAMLVPIGTAILGVIVGESFELWSNSWMNDFSKASIILLVLVSALVVVDILISDKKIQQMDIHEKNINDKHEEILEKLGTNAGFFKVETGRDNSGVEMFSLYAELIKEAKKEILVLQYRPTFDDKMWTNYQSPAFKARDTYYKALNELIQNNLDNDNFVYTRIVQLEQCEVSNKGSEAYEYCLAPYDETCYKHMEHWIKKNNIRVSIKKAPISLGATLIIIDKEHIIIEFPNMEDTLLLGVLYIEDTDLSLYSKLKNIWMHVDRKSYLVENIDEIYSQPSNGRVI